MGSLTEVRVTNFKAFAAEQSAELAPLTLVYGPNSGGKSSLLQAFLLLKQSTPITQRFGLRPLSRAAFAPLDLVPHGELADLGSFKTLISRHDDAQELRLSFTFEASDRRRVGQALRKLWRQARITLCFRKDRSRRQRTTSEVPTLVKAVFEFDDLPAITLCLTERKVVPLDDSGSSDPSRTQVFVLARESLEPFVRTCVAYDPDPSWVLRRYLPLRARPEQHPAGGASELVPIREETLQAGVEQLAPLLQRTVFLSRPSGVPCRPELLPEQADTQNTEALPPAEARDDTAVAYMLTGGGAVLETLADEVDSLLGSLTYLGPLRKPPARFFVPASDPGPSVGVAGEHAPALLHRRGDKFSSRVNDWFEKLGINYQLSTKHISDEIAGDLVSMTLIERDTGVPVAPPDVGFGIGQLLPIVVEGLTGHRRTILVEQPEIHLHPKLQACVADFLLETALKDRGNRNQWLVETHSEAIMLRLQRRIRENGSATGLPVRPEDVSVLYVRPGPNGSTIQRLRIGEDGTFLDDWPDGFFEERFNELLGE